ncbi:MAG: glycoside hydrolase family 2 sugar binding protein, partial [Alphaproteobacteria bacterium]|nr:glycoside hydrolase family 2 sugar binding protein [Alphaproteobacteria bacterium]
MEIYMSDNRPNFARIDRLNYPRPQFYRPRYMKLNGEWQFDFDDGRRGMEEKWFERDHKLSRTINVPFAYQTELSGINDKTPHDIGWNKRNFSIPKEWEDINWIDYDLLLHFGAVDYRAQVFINGEEAYLNEGGHVPFYFDITPYLKNGGFDEQITVRAEDTEDTDQPRGKQVAHPHDMYYTNTSFIWQDVWLEVVPKTRIQQKGFKVTPSAENKAVYFEIPITLAHNVAYVEVEAYDASDPSETPAAKTIGKIKGAGTRMRLQFEGSIKLWTPDTPNLYNLRIRLWGADGQILDEVLSYTGIRDIEVRPEGYYLSGEHFFL